MDLKKAKNGKRILVGCNFDGSPIHYRVTEKGDLDVKIISDDKLNSADFVAVFSVGNLLVIYPGNTENKQEKLRF